MADTTKTYNIDADLEAALIAAAASGEPVRVKGTKILQVRVDDVDGVDIWEDYDPDKARAALKKAVGIFTKDEAEEIIKRIYQGREDGTRPVDRP